MDLLSTSQFQNAIRRNRKTKHMVAAETNFYSEKKKTQSQLRLSE